MIKLKIKKSKKYYYILQQKQFSIFGIKLWKYWTKCFWVDNVNESGCQHIKFQNQADAEIYIESRTGIKILNYDKY